MVFHISIVNSIVLGLVSNVVDIKEYLWNFGAQVLVFILLLLIGFFFQISYIYNLTLFGFFDLFCVCGLIVVIMNMISAEKRAEFSVQIIYAIIFGIILMLLSIMSQIQNIPLYNQ